MKMSETLELSAEREQDLLTAAEQRSSEDATDQRPDDGRFGFSAGLAARERRRAELLRRAIRQLDDLRTTLEAFLREEESQK